jgi:hypothetical protein
VSNAEGHSHVRGAGYSSVSRKCVKCKHPELEHYERRCNKGVQRRDKDGFSYVSRCRCRGFAARRLDKAERAIIRAKASVRQSKLQLSISPEADAWVKAGGDASQVGQDWWTSLHDEWAKRKVE